MTKSMESTDVSGTGGIRTGSAREGDEPAAGVFDSGHHGPRTMLAGGVSSLRGQSAGRYWRKTPVMCGV